MSQYRAGNRSKLGSLMRRFSFSQKEYFKVDLVKEYSCHRFAIIGEERTGFPPLGVFEAMACGCIVIIDPTKYEGLDMLPGKNCLEMGLDINESIDRAMSLSAQEIEQISNSARNFARQNWNSNTIATLWKANLEL